MGNTKFNTTLSKFIGKKCELRKVTYDEGVVKENACCVGVLKGLSGYGGLIYDMGSLGVLKTTRVLCLTEVTERTVELYTINSVYQLTLLGSYNQQGVEKALEEAFNMAKEKQGSMRGVFQGDMANVVSKSMER